MISDQSFLDSSHIVISTLFSHHAIEPFRNSRTTPDKGLLVELISPGLQAQRIPEQSTQFPREGGPGRRSTGFIDLGQFPEQVRQTRLARGRRHLPVGPPEVGDQRAVERFRKKRAQRWRSPRLVDHVIRGLFGGKAPQPSCFAGFSPPGFIRMKYTGFLHVLADLLIPLVEHLGHPVPGVNQPSNTQLELQMVADHGQHHRHGHANTVMEPAGQRHQPMTERGPRQCIRNRRLHQLLATGTPLPRNRVLHHFYFRNHDILDQPESSFAWFRYLSAALGTGLQRRMLFLAGWFRRGTSLALMALLGAWFFLASTLRWFLVGWNHTRWRRPLDGLFLLKCRQLFRQVHQNEDGLFLFHGQDGFCLFPRKRNCEVVKFLLACLFLHARIVCTYWGKVQVSFGYNHGLLQKFASDG